jgi:hypothetical protein
MDPSDIHTGRHIFEHRQTVDLLIAVGFISANVEIDGTIVYSSTELGERKQHIETVGI